MKKNPLPNSVFASTKPSETENEKTKKQPSPQVASQRKRNINVNISYDTFQRLWTYCGIKNKRMNATIEKALDLFLSKEDENG